MRKRYKIAPFIVVFILVIGLFGLIFVFSKSLIGKGSASNNPPIKKVYTEEELIFRRYDAGKIKSFVADVDLKFDYSEATNSSEDLPFVHANNAIVIDLTTNKVLFERNSSDRALIASLTKVMTAVVALEHKKIEDIIEVSEQAASIGENTMGVSEGETYTLEELLYGLVLHSGNDAAYAIADGVSGNTQEFVAWMNLKAKELGLKDTQFYDPSGLDDNNHSTAEDLARLTRYALKNPDFKRIVATVDYEISYDEGKHKYLPLENQTNLLTTYPGVKGVKTGYTEEAQYSLISYAENYGHELVAVELDSDARKTDMIQMLDYSFEKLGYKIEHPLLDF